jgi:hypothetical protein
MDLGLDRFGLAHDSRCRILLFGSCSSEIGALADMAILNVNSGCVIPGNFCLHPSNLTVSGSSGVTH